MKEEPAHNNEAACSHCAADISEEKEPLWKQKKALVLLASFIALSAGLYLEFVLSGKLYAHVFYLIVIAAAGHDILARAWSSLLGKRFDMNVLMSVAAIGAFLSGYAEEGASVIFLFAIAEFLEEYAGERVRSSIAALLKLAPETARLKRNGKEVEVDVHLLKAGDIVIVKPGDRIPIDGTVVHGNSYVNEAAITGESVPSGKEKGSRVYAGTINGDGYLELQVSKPSGQTMLSKIAAIVENAEKQKSRTEKFVDRFAAIYTPVVIAASILVATVPAFVFGQPFDTWFYRALVLLVTACPCALAISTPVSLVSGISSAAKNGVLVKGGDYLEGAARTKAVIFDKTGTLTQGIFEVTDVVPVNGYAKEELLRIAASLEAKSTHPVGKAIIAAAPRELRKVTKFVSYPGKGIKGAISGTDYFVGNLKLPVKVDGKSRNLMLRMESEGKTVVVVATREKAVGIISISDRLREGAVESVRELAGLGITPIMLTGDNKETAAAIAKQVGISHFHAGLLPEQKLEEVKRLKKKYGMVMMVGDGVNDAPALAAADVGIAMGAIGSDVAIETADAAIMKDDLSRIPFLVKLGRKTMLVVKENVAASILIKGSIAIMAFFGLTSLWIAVAVGDMGLSLLVIANALRLGITKLRTPF
ncbi:MAG: cation-translocating P-type ATPase [Candidatus Anstonellaceae archaeon]